MRRGVWSWWRGEFRLDGWRDWEVPIAFWNSRLRFLSSCLLREWNEADTLVLVSIYLSIFTMNSKTTHHAPA